MKTSGQLAYEADLIARPTYHDGKPRKTWFQLNTIERWSWNKLPFQAFTNYRLPDGKIVPVDATAAKLEPIIGFQLKGGAIVDAIRADISTAEAARYGNLARVAMNFYITTGNPAELTAATVYAKLAAHGIVREYVHEM